MSPLPISKITGISCSLPIETSPQVQPSATYDLVLAGMDFMRALVLFIYRLS